MAGRRLDISPVFNHKKSVALVDTAEDLVDSLDNLSVCLKHIEEKYIKNQDGTVESKTEATLYEKLKENLDTARELTDTLKREKWRLSRRQMSVELRMGELEEYKSHLKQDMTDMNQTVESLSMRIIQLEDSLIEAQELQEHTEAERVVAEKRLAHADETIKDLEEKQGKLVDEIRKLKMERKDSVLRMQHNELKDEIEILMLENRSLKELIRSTEEKENDKCSANDLCKNTTTDSTDANRNVKCNGDDVISKSDDVIQESPRYPVITETTEIAYV